MRAFAFRIIGVWALLPALVLLGLPLRRGARAQTGTAQQTLTVVVEPVTRMELSDDLSMTVKQGQTQTVTTSYALRTNRAAAQVIQASASVETDLPGLEVTATMTAPDAESQSMGTKVLLSGDGTATKTLVEDVQGTDAADVELVYEVRASPKTPPGSWSVSITYTLSEE